MNDSYLDRVNNRLIKEFSKQMTGKPDPDHVYFAHDVLKRILREENFPEMSVFNVYKRRKQDISFLCRCIDTALKSPLTSLTAQKALEHINTTDQGLLYLAFKADSQEKDPVKLFERYALFTNLGFDFEKEMVSSTLSAGDKLRILMSFKPPKDASGQTQMWLNFHLSRNLIEYLRNPSKDIDGLLKDYYFENQWSDRDEMVLYDSVQNYVKDPVDVVKKYIDIQTRNYTINFSGGQWVLKSNFQNRIGLNKRQQQDVLKYLAEACITGYVETGRKDQPLKVKLDPIAKYAISAFCSAYDVKDLSGTIRALIAAEPQKNKKNALANMDLGMTDLDIYKLQVDYDLKTNRTVNIPRYQDMCKNPKYAVDATAFVLMSVTSVDTNIKAKKNFDKSYGYRYITQSIKNHDFIISEGLVMALTKHLSKDVERCNQLLEKLEGEYGFTDRLLDQVRRYMPDTVKRPSSRHVQQFSPKSEENAIKASVVKPNLRQKLKAIRKKIKGMILRQRPEKKLVSIRYFKKEESTQRVTKSLKASQINKVPLKSCLKTSKPKTKTSEPRAKKKVSFPDEGPKSKENTNGNKGNTPHGP